jgi:hypothetical protein
MKKPVKKTAKELDALVAKATPKLRVRQNHIKSGGLEDIRQTFENFAARYGLKVSEVRLVQGSWGKAYLSAKSLETDAEVRARVESDANRRYDDARYKYQSWLYQEQERQRQEQLIAQNSIKYNTQCCPSDCCCRRR